MTETRARRMVWIEPALLIALTALAAVLRFISLSQLPPGFHHDEAFEAVEALKLLANPGYRPLFFSGNFGVEPLFIYLTALSFKLFGASPQAMRGVAALAGTLTVPALYALGKELERVARRPLVGLGVTAAGALAGMYWHLTFSRVGIEPVLVPLDTILTLLFLCRGLRTGRLWAFALSGILLGLSPYTYPAGRLLPFLALLFAGYSLLVDRTLWRSRRTGLFLCAAAALIVFLPLGITFAQQPDLLTLRTQQVAVFAEGQGSAQPSSSILDNVWSTLKGFSFAGDTDPRSNLPGRPLLDPFWAILFYAGIVLALLQLRDRPAGLLLLWLGIMLAPTIFSEYAPHFRRALGAVPAVCLLIALPVSVLLGRRTEGASLPAGWRPVLIVLLVLGFASSISLNVRDYFVRWAASPELFYAYDEGLARVAQRIASAGEERIYLSPRSASHPTLGFFLWNRPTPRSFDGRQGIVLPPAGTPATYWIILHEDWRSEALLARHLPDARPVDEIRDAQNKPYARAYKQPANGRVLAEPSKAFPARFGDSITLLGWQPVNPTPRAGEVLYVDLSWRAEARPAQSYTVFVHLLGEFNPATDGPLWAGTDIQPCGGACQTQTWDAGETVVDEIQINLPVDLPAGTYQVELGWYNSATQERLPVLGAGGKPADTRLLPGTITVR